MEEFVRSDLKFFKVILLNRKEISLFNFRVWKKMEERKIGEQRSIRIDDIRILMRYPPLDG